MDRGKPSARKPNMQLPKQFIQISDTEDEEEDSSLKLSSPVPFEEEEREEQNEVRKHFHSLGGKTGKQGTKLLNKNECKAPSVAKHGNKILLDIRMRGRKHFQNLWTPVRMSWLSGQLNNLGKKREQSVTLQQTPLKQGIKLLNKNKCTVQSVANQGNKFGFDERNKGQTSSKQRTKNHAYQKQFHTLSENLRKGKRGFRNRKQIWEQNEISVDVKETKRPKNSERKVLSKILNVKELRNMVDSVNEIAKAVEALNGPPEPFAKPSDTSTKEKSEDEKPTKSPQTTLQQMDKKVDIPGKEALTSPQILTKPKKKPVPTLVLSPGQRLDINLDSLTNTIQIVTDVQVTERKNGKKNKVTNAFLTKNISEKRRKVAQHKMGKKGAERKNKSKFCRAKTKAEISDFNQVKHETKKKKGGELSQKCKVNENSNFVFEEKMGSLNNVQRSDSKRLDGEQRLDEKPLRRQLGKMEQKKKKKELVRKKYPPPPF